MTLSFGVILVLPFDVWAIKGGLSAATPYLWQILFAFIALFIVVIIPFAFWYYEGHDTKYTNPLKQTMCQVIYGLVASIISLVVACICIIISYIWLGFAQIAVETQVRDDFALAYDTAYYSLSTDSLVYTTVHFALLNIRMSFVVYLVAMLSIAGWVIFALFGGCGMSALPVELIFMFAKRPKPLSQHDFELSQKIFAMRAERLIKVGRELDKQRKTTSGRMGRKNMGKYQRFKKAVYQCEDDYKKIEIAYKEMGGNPLLYFGALVLGIICIAIAALWVIHMILYMIPPKPIWGFLNVIFYYLDKGFPLFGLIAYLIFTYYLLFAVLAGNVCIMSRIPIISVFPLKKKNTATTSFLYNAGLMLLASITIVQFTAHAFRDYIKYTSIDGFFNVIVGNMKYIKYFYNYVHYAFFGMIFIGGLLTLLASVPAPWNGWHKQPEQKEIDSILKDLEQEVKK
jgi:LMBR1 domain-containing protein 1